MDENSKYFGDVKFIITTLIGLAILCLGIYTIVRKRRKGKDRSGPAQCAPPVHFQPPPSYTLVPLQPSPPIFPFTYPPTYFPNPPPYFPNPPPHVYVVIPNPDSFPFSSFEQIAAGASPPPQPDGNSPSSVAARQQESLLLPSPKVTSPPQAAMDPQASLVSSTREQEPIHGPP